MALTEAQLLVDDVWREVSKHYVDPTYNGQGEEGWKQQRTKALTQVANVAPEDDREIVVDAIRNMLKSLGDPYTRFLREDQFATLKSYATGSVVGDGGIGVQLIGDPASGFILVANVVPNSPAARAGLQPGDLIESIDGQSLSQSTAEIAAAKCRGEEGSKVNLKVLRRQKGKADSEQEYSLVRSPVQTNPVQSSTMKTPSGKSVGIITLKSFNQQTTSQVIDALDKKLQSAEVLVVDLRGNPGGYMPAGVDVAKLFLPPKARVISEVDRSGRATIFINDGVGSDTTRPLFLLVDERSASASEILAAALQDNHRATIVSDDNHTFGKGRIQNVQELFDGSGLAITKAKYTTPSGKDIQGAGIVPDIKSEACGKHSSVALCIESLL